MSERQPIFNAPGVVLALLAAFVAVHLGRDLLSVDADERILELFAFVPDRLGPAVQHYAGGAITAVTQFVSHIFLHGDGTHLLINSAWFLAFATPVARRLGTARFLVFFLLCGIGGAALFLFLNDAPMVGASGAISGLMGATLRFLFLPLGDGNADALSGNGPAPALSLSQALTNRRVLIAVLGWSLFNLLAAWGAQALLPDMSIAWEAHLGGFFTGFLLFGLFDPQLRSQ